MLGAAASRKATLAHRGKSGRASRAESAGPRPCIEGAKSVPFRRGAQPRGDPRGSLTGVTGPAFLLQDSSWRTVSIPWGGDYNTQLSNATRNSLPAVESPVRPPELRIYQFANDTSLRLLDSRQITASGELPRHLCGMAFGGWEKAEGHVVSRLQGLTNHGRETDESRLDENLTIAWLCIFKFNLANLSLIDETTPQFMTSMAHQEIATVQELLENMEPHEVALERALGGLPSPTRQVRFAIQYAVAGR